MFFLENDDTEWFLYLSQILIDTKSGFLVLLLDHWKKNPGLEIIRI